VQAGKETNWVSIRITATVMEMESAFKLLVHLIHLTHPTESSCALEGVGSDIHERLYKPEHELR
jgi:hypothetical protein